MQICQLSDLQAWNLGYCLSIKSLSTGLTSYPSYADIGKHWEVS